VLDIPEFWSGNDFNFLEQFGRLGIQFSSHPHSRQLMHHPDQHHNQHWYGHA
jgi:hypothetical protein